MIQLVLKWSWQLISIFSNFLLDFIFLVLEPCECRRGDLYMLSIITLFASLTRNYWYLLFINKQDWWFWLDALELTLVRANLTRVTWSPNSTPRRFPFYLLITFLLYFLFICYLPRCTLPDFLLSLPWLPCHFYLVIEQHASPRDIWTIIASGTQIFGE